MVYNINWWKKELYPLFNKNISESPDSEQKIPGNREVYFTEWGQYNEFTGQAG